MRTVGPALTRAGQRAADEVAAQALRLSQHHPLALIWSARLCAAIGRPRQAYDSLDRLLGIEPRNPAAWRQMRLVLRQADPQLAFWIGLKARSQLRSDLMAAALKRLVDLEAESDRILALLPDPAWPRPAPDAFLTDFGPEIGSKRLLAVASLALQVGRAKEAEAILEWVRAAEANTVESRLALALLLEQSCRYPEAETVLWEVVEARPAHWEARLNLARIQCQAYHYDEALKTLEGLLALAPENHRAWFEYGQILRSCYERPAGTDDRAFERAGELAGTDLITLERVGQYFREERKYDKALRFYDRLFTQNPGAIENPVACRHYAECLRACGRGERAAELAQAGARRCDDMARGCSGEAWERVMAEKARILHEAGRETEAVETLRAIRAVSEPSAAAFSRPEYLPDTPDRLQRLRDIVGSRDLVILLPGPSFADFAARLPKLADLDFCVAALGSFPPIEHELLRSIGRGADVLFITHPAMLRTWFSALEDYLTRPSTNLFLTTHYTLSSLLELGTDHVSFITKHDRRLLLVHPVNGPPLPSRPLHFEHGNSLAVLVPLLLFGRPKRIFIAGADGGADPPTGNRPYFFYKDIDSDEPESDFAQAPDMISFKGRQERLQEANRRFRRDAAQADEVIVWALQDLHTIFELPVPPIYNLCPYSAHAAFPRIDCDTAVAMLKTVSVESG
jgi:tetratricopeptide (TPR) repeat protein